MTPTHGGYRLFLYVVSLPTKSPNNCRSALTNCIAADATAWRSAGPSTFFWITDASAAFFVPSSSSPHRMQSESADVK